MHAILNNCVIYFYVVAIASSSLDMYLGVESLCYMANSLLNPLRNCKTVFQNGRSISSLPAMYEDTNFSISFAKSVTVCLYYSNSKL